MNYPTLTIGFHWAPLGGSWYVLFCCFVPQCHDPQPGVRSLEISSPNPTGSLSLGPLVRFLERGFSPAWGTMISICHLFSLASTASHCCDHLYIPLS